MVIVHNNTHDRLHWANWRSHFPASMLTFRHNYRVLMIACALIFSILSLLPPFPVFPPPDRHQTALVWPPWTRSRSARRPTCWRLSTTSTTASTTFPTSGPSSWWRWRTCGWSEHATPAASSTWRWSVPTNSSRRSSWRSSRTRRCETQLPPCKRKWKLGQTGRWEGPSFFIGEGWRESPLGRNLHFSDVTFTVCGFKTGSSDHRNNTPATGESSKQRILFFEHPLLHLFLLLLLTPVLKSVWGPFCLSMMSYLVRVVAICQDTYTDTHNTHTHTHTHTLSHSLFHLSSSERRSLQGSVSPFWGNRFTHFEAHVFQPSRWPAPLSIISEITLQAVDSEKKKQKKTPSSVTYCCSQSCRISKNTARWYIYSAGPRGISLVCNGCRQTELPDLP